MKVKPNSTDWMEAVEFEDPRDRADLTYKRKRRYKDWSLHRDRKLATHTTVNGQGKIAQLRKGTKLSKAT